MKVFIKTIKTVVSLITCSIILVVFVTIFLLFVLLPARQRYSNKIYYLLMHYCARLLIACSFIRLVIKGKENIPIYPYAPAIIIANHTSALDIPLITMLVNGYPHIWLGKDVYAKIPFFGFLFRRMNVPVKKNSPAQARAALTQALTIAREHTTHILLFPEGRRYNDGNIHKFYHGFCTLAVELNRPVIPIAIYGMNKIFPKNSFLVDSGACLVKISIGKPLLYTPTETPQQFLERIHTWCVHELEQLSHH